MKSVLPKVLHTIGGRSLVHHAIAAARGLDPLHLEVVVRHDRDRVAAHVASCDPDCIIADQDEIKGTGRAVECGLEALPADLSGTVVVTYGDVPLLSAQTLQAMVTAHHEQDAAVTVVTSLVPDPSGYGRVLRDVDGSVLRIVEHKDADESQRAVREINSGIYAFEATLLRDALAGLSTSNAQGEKYLTDVIAVARDRGRRVSAYQLDDIWQTEGVNDRAQLARLGAELNRRTLERLMLDGITVVDPATTWVDSTVSIGRDSTIHPNTQILGATTIGEQAIVGPDTTLADMEVGDCASIVRTHARLSVVGADAAVGPFVHLRPGTEIGTGAVVGAFVELKNAVLAAESVIPHLAYVGDATVSGADEQGADPV